MCLITLWEVHVSSSILTLHYLNSTPLVFDFCNYGYNVYEFSILLQLISMVEVSAASDNFGKNLANMSKKYLHINICKIYLHLHLVITYFIFLINLTDNLIRILGIILILSITDAPLIQNIIESHLYVIHCLCLVLHFYLIFLVWSIKNRSKSRTKRTIFFVCLLLHME